MPAASLDPERLTGPSTVTSALSAGFPERSVTRTCNVAVPVAAGARFGGVAVEGGSCGFGAAAGVGWVVAGGAGGLAGFGVPAVVCCAAIVSARISGIIRPPHITVVLAAQPCNLIENARG